MSKPKISPISVIFFGTPEFAVSGLKALLNSPRYAVKLVITQPDKKSGRGNKLTASPVKELALSSNIPVLQPDNIKKDISGFIQAAKQHGDFDIGVVIAFGQILPQEVLDLPKAGCVNVHASLLPRWRGAAPIQRAVMEGDSESGICLMRMEAGLDTGPVYCFTKTKITEQDSAGSLHDRLAGLSSALLGEKLSDIAAGKLQAVAQPSNGLTYAKKITNEEARIDWSKPAQQVARLIRGLNPAPGAYSSFASQRLKVFNAEAKPQIGEAKAPGSVANIGPRSIEIQCGSGVVSLLELQLEGKRRMPVEEFLRGGALSASDKLD